MAERDLLVGVTEARVRLRELLQTLGDRNVVVLRHNRPVAVLTHPDRLERLIGRVEDLEDYVAALESRLEPGEREAHEDMARRVADRHTSVTS
jgi:PHD/YefM family antitoxin component YafN of YafNO toxin-antitoxin module